MPSQDQDLHLECLWQAAQARQLPTSILNIQSQADPPKRWLQFQIASQSYRFRRGALFKASSDKSFTHINGGLAFEISKRKSLTKTFLQTAGISTPMGASFTREEAILAEAWFRSWGKAVCLKPETGKQARLVYPYIQERQAFREAFTQISLSYRQVLVEENFPGDVLRYFYLRPRVVAMKLSRAANVTGDGVQNLHQLIESYNQLRLERKIPGHGQIAIDHYVNQCLSRQGLDLNDVPAAGQNIRLHDLALPFTGMENVSCSAHPSYTQIIEKACQSIPGLRIAGVDLMVQDRHQPASAENYRLLEINSSPGVATFHYLWEGAVQDVSGAILDMLAREQSA